MKEYIPEVVSLPSIHLIGMRYQGPYWELGPIIDRAYQWARDNFMLVGGNLSAVFYDNPRNTMPEKWRSLIGIPVNEDFDSRALPERFEEILLESCLMVRVLYEGFYYSQEKFQAYLSLYQWLQNSLDYIHQGSMAMERYLNSPHVLLEQETATEISFFITEK